MSRIAAFVGSALIAVAVLAGAMNSTDHSHSPSQHTARLSADSTPAPAASDAHISWG
jgi:hypothetical protein